MKPYRNIYHALNRSISGLTVEQYIKAGWQSFYTAKAADGRRLDRFDDGLNPLERNAQDSITRSLILSTLKPEQHSLWIAALIIKHNANSHLIERMAQHLAQHLNTAHNIPPVIGQFVILEWAEHNPCKFAEHLRRTNSQSSHNYRLRDRTLRQLTEWYDASVGYLEDTLIDHDLF